MSTAWESSRERSDKSLPFKLSGRSLSRLIGRSFDGSDFIPFLKSAITIADFQIFGNFLVCRE
jgi:hypothetical protein